MHPDRCQQQGDDQQGEQQQAQVPADLDLVQLLEAILEGQHHQEGGEDLGTGLQHPDLLEQLVPVAVQTFRR